MTYRLRDRCFAEAAGTALLVAIGTGSIVAGANSGGAPPWVLAVAWFAAVAVPIQLFAVVSGAHLNPAVTLGLVTARRFPPREALPFAGSQVAGAFVGSIAVREIWGSAAHLGATLPGPAGPAWILPLEGAFTFLLVLSVLHLFGLGRAPSRLELILPAAVVGVSTFVIGPWTGSSLNPARSLAPAVLSGQLDWLGLYLVAALAGALGAVAAGRGLRCGRVPPRADGPNSPGPGAGT